MKTITGKANAYVTAYREGREINALDDMCVTPADMTEHGWVRVGDAEITVELFGDAEITRSQVAVLNEAKRRLQAETQAKLTQIDGQIQSLLAIECK